MNNSTQLIMIMKNTGTQKGINRMHNQEDNKDISQYIKKQTELSIAMGNAETQSDAFTLLHQSLESQEEYYE
jgi:hypothetical protein